MERHEPFVERDMAVLEDRAHSDGELLAARAALPNAFARYLISPDFLGLPAIGGSLVDSPTSPQ